jgi:hypothetical protein
VPTVVFEELIIIVTYLLACNLVVQHVVSCNWVLPVGNIFIIIIIIIIKYNLTFCVVCVFTLQIDDWFVHNRLFNANFEDKFK